MRRELAHALLIGMLLLNLTGCGGRFGIGGTQTVPDKRQKLSDAVNMIKAGRESEARRLLELVIDDSGVDGVTDEALFRLAIINLSASEPGDGKDSIALLDKLRSSYPASVWTRQSAPLHSYLMGVKTVRSRNRELNTLREKNISLNREVRELRETIERLKALDRELEQKIRR